MSLVLYAGVYVLLCIITSVIVCHLGSFDTSDAILIGFIGAFSPIALPIIVLGVLSSLIYNQIYDYFYYKSR